MTNNDILRRLRYAFDLSDDQMIALFESAELTVSRSQISDWLKKDDEESFQSLTDTELAIFLNGFINEKRGKKPGPPFPPEKRLNNNIILRKLKIALSLRDDDILDIMQLVDLKFSKHEISAFFRKPTQSQYRLCKDQFLRNFIFGLQKRYRP